LEYVPEPNQEEAAEGKGNVRSRGRINIDNSNKSDYTN
jgi:hypothetical protein